MYNYQLNLELLAQYEILLLKGNDNINFLHANVTQDLKDLSIDHVKYSGYCDYKGRLNATMIIWLENINNELYILVKKDLSKFLIEIFSKYILKRDVTIEISDRSKIYGITDFKKQIDTINFHYIDIPIIDLKKSNWNKIRKQNITLISIPSSINDELRLICIVNDSDLSIPLTDHYQITRESIWDLLDKSSGIPWINSFNKGKFTPYDVNLDLLKGISFSKGCYPGQEVIARIKYLGKIKKRMFYGKIGKLNFSKYFNINQLTNEYIFSLGNRSEPCGRIIDWTLFYNGYIYILFELPIKEYLNKDNELYAFEYNGPKIQIKALPYDIF